jgi:tripartite-type tricarboxylate transporter receptor subunit TctC
VPGYLSSGWGGLSVPARTPQKIQRTLYEAMMKTMKDPTTNAALVKLGAEPMATNGEEFAAMIKRDCKSLAEAIRVSGITPN